MFGLIRKWLKATANPGKYCTHSSAIASSRLHHQFPGIHDACRVEVRADCLDRRDARLALFGGQPGHVVTSHPMLVADRPAVRHDRFARRRLQPLSWEGL